MEFNSKCILCLLNTWTYKHTKTEEMYALQLLKELCVDTEDLFHDCAEFLMKVLNLLNEADELTPLNQYMKQ